MTGLERIVLSAIFSYIATIHPLFKILVFIAHLEKFPHQFLYPPLQEANSPPSNNFCATTQ